MRCWNQNHQRTSGRPGAGSFCTRPSANQSSANCGERLRALSNCAGLALLFPLFATCLFAQPIVGVDNPASLNAPTLSPANAPAAGSAAEEVRLGASYLLGKGVPKDPVQSAYWFRKAADQGDPGAQNELGYLYTFGIGVQQDPAEATRWFERALAGGSEHAKLNLAVMYLRGVGIDRDIHLGLDLLTQLAARGNARAEDYLGAVYYSGFGVDQNKALGEMWFRKSAKGKCPEGEYAMGTLYSVIPDHEQNNALAAKFLRRSAEAGFVPAMSSLGILSAAHPELPGNRSEEMLAMLTRAAEAGMWESSATLGYLFRDGRGVPQDTRQACRWFSIAARQGGSAGDENTRADWVRCQQELTEDQLSRTSLEATNWVQQHPQSNLYVFSNGLTIPHL
jgi:TPR repeat protein